MDPLDRIAMELTALVDIHRQLLDIERGRDKLTREHLERGTEQQTKAFSLAEKTLGVFADSLAKKAERALTSPVKAELGSGK